VTDEAPKPAAPYPFPHVRVAFLVLVADAILFIATPPNPIRSIFSVAALLATGYCALDLFVGTQSQFRLPEILAYSVGLGILATGGSALVMWAFGIPFTEATVLFLGLPIGLLAMLGTPPMPRRGVMRTLAALDDLPGYSRGERTATRILVVAAMVSLAVLVSVAFVEVPSTVSPGLAITGTDGTPDSLPLAWEAGEPRSLLVTVFGGREAASLSVRIRLAPANATGSEMYHAVAWAGWNEALRVDALGEAAGPVSVAPRGKVTQRLGLVLEAAGEFEVRFELVGSGATLARATLPVTVQ
jgi:hypothetical protein